MSNFSGIIEKHLNIWSDTNRDRRRKAIEEIYSKDCIVVDPFYPEAFQGHDALMTLINEVQGKFPRFVFRINSQDEHHNVAKFTWFYGPAGDTPVVTGEDFFFIEEGLIQQLYVFIDKTG
ncbi:nuclear transport factor 2 family protein [Paenibacillus sp. TAF58]